MVLNEASRSRRPAFRVLLAATFLAAVAAPGPARAGGAALGARDLLALEQALTDRTLAATAGGPTPLLTQVEWERAGGPPPDLQAGLLPLRARFPAGGDLVALRLPKGWKAQRLRLAAVPALDEERKDPAPALHALPSISTRPSSAAVLRWPELGARLESGGMVYLLVPGVERAEPGPPQRAWFLLAYRAGRLTAALAATEARWIGVTYGWEEGGG